MKLDGMFKTVIKFAPMALKLARNEKFQQLLKICWHLYANRNQGRVNATVVNSKQVNQERVSPKQVSHKPAKKPIRKLK